MPKPRRNYLPDTTDEIWNCSGLNDHIEYYNTDRLHFSLGMDNYETPMMAFRNKKTDKETRTHSPNWMEEGNG